MAIRARPKVTATEPKVPGEYESHLTPVEGFEGEEPSRQIVTLDDDPVSQAVEAGGSLMVDLDAGKVSAGAPQGAFDQQAEGEYNHYENVAQRLTETELQSIGQKVHEAVTQDIESRKDWESMLAAGTSMLTSGEVEDVSKLAAPMQVVKHIKHPIFAIAVYQFQTRAYKQLLPPTGPVKCAITGQRTEELMQKSDRVETYMNYQLVQEDPSYAEQTDQLLLIEAIDGSTFRKWYRDQLKKRNVGRWCRAVDVIVPYGAESMESAVRITHRYKQHSADVHRLMLSPEEGYLQIALGEPPPAGESSMGAGQTSEVTQATDRLQGISPSVTALMDESQEYTFYEQQVYLDLSEHVDEDGEPTGVPLPYVVTIESETQKVMCIWRDWDEKDENQSRLQHFAHYKFLPGPGFYGLGYAHLLCGLAAGVTASLRILLVGSLYASAGGGFVTRDAGGKMPSSISIEPGLYKAIDLTFDEISKAFYTPPFKEPSQALPAGIEMLLKAAERLSSTVEAMVGDAPTTGPVGTTLALIEQSGELYSGIHQRNHRAMADELRMQFRLDGIYIPEGGYPYIKGDQDQVIYKQDFENQIDVRPVSDPNIFSSTQRIALAQAQVQVATEHPDVVNKRVAIKRLLQAMRVPDLEELMLKQAQAVAADPITENAMILMGMPVKTDIKQDHDGHNFIHGPIVQDPNVQPMAKAAMNAHMAEHMAMKVIAQAMAAGLPVQIPQRTENGEPPVKPVDPQIEQAITQKAVQLVQQQKQTAGQGVKAPEQIEAEGRVQVRMTETQGTLKNRSEEIRGMLKIRANESQVKLKIAAEEARGRMRLKEMEQAHRQKIESASQRLKRCMEVHAALLKGGTAKPEEVDEAQGQVDEAQGQLTQAVFDLADGLSALATQVQEGMEHILTEVQTEEETEHASSSEGDQG